MVSNLSSQPIQEQLSKLQPIRFHQTLLALLTKHQEKTLNLFQVFQHMKMFSQLQATLYPTNEQNTETTAFVITNKLVASGEGQIFFAVFHPPSNLSQNKLMFLCILASALVEYSMFEYKYTLISSTSTHPLSKFDRHFYFLKLFDALEKKTHISNIF